MNTLTHALVGAAIFGRPKLTLTLLSATLAGAAFPDVSILVMVFWEIGVNGVDQAELWGQSYYREPWVTYSAITNSFFVFGALALLGWQQGWQWLWAFAGTAVLHFLGDIFLHYDDGHAHFWPLSSCVFYSPISYWDPRHFGVPWTVVEMIVALALAGFIWRQNKSWVVRTYATVLVGLFWLMSLAFLMFIFTSDDRDGGLELSAPGKFVLPACPGSIDVAKQTAQIELLYSQSGENLDQSQKTHQL